MWKCICLALVAVFLLALILLLSFFRDVLSDRQHLLIESRLENLILLSDNLELKRNHTSLRLGLEATNALLEGELEWERNNTERCEQFYVDALVESETQRGRADDCLSSIPFLPVADGFSRQHEYVPDVFDCSQFSSGCADLWQSMGYTAYPKTVTVDSEAFNCTNCLHSIAIIELPVECTPPNVRIITPSEFKIYGLG
jgi:hypothetical protein